jgi:hypothetical protein
VEVSPTVRFWLTQAHRLSSVVVGVQEFRERPTPRDTFSSSHGQRGPHVPFLHICLARWAQACQRLWDTFPWRILVQEFLMPILVREFPNVLKNCTGRLWESCVVLVTLICTPVLHHISFYNLSPLIATWCSLYFLICNKWFLGVTVWLHFAAFWFHIFMYSLASLLWMHHCLD